MPASYRLRAERSNKSEDQVAGVCCLCASIETSFWAKNLDEALAQLEPMLFIPGKWIISGSMGRKKLRERHWIVNRNRPKTT